MLARILRLFVPDQHFYLANRRIATPIRDRLAQPWTLNEWVTKLIGDFAIRPAKCRDEAETFLAKLAPGKLVAHLNLP